MKTPLVSVAMATYNGEKFLRQQLDSILNQTYENLEIIICDDVSSDTTTTILKEYNIKDPRIKIYQNEKNVGLVKNFQNALSYCTGDFIALADQDDIWLPDKIEKLVNHIGDSLLIHSDAILIDETDTVIANSFTKYANKNTTKTFMDYLFSNNVTGCTVLMKKELLINCLPFPEGVSIHDWWLALLASYQNALSYLNEPLILYRQHNNNQIGATSKHYIPSFAKREKNIEMHLNMLRIIQTYFQHVPLMNNLIAGLIRYHEDFFTKQIRFHSFTFHLLNFQKFHKEKPILLRLLSLFISLFGKDIQKMIWSNTIIKSFKRVFFHA